MAQHPRYTFPAASVRSGAVTTLLVPQPPMPFLQDRPIPDQPYGHAGTLRNIVVSDSHHMQVLSYPLTLIRSPPVDAAGNRWPDDYLEGVPPLNQDVAMQGQQPDLGYNDADYYGVVHHPFDQPQAVDPAIPNEYRDQGINNYAGIAQDIPAQAQAAAPIDPVIDMAGRPAQNAPARPAPAFLNELLNQRPVPNEQLNEVLRQLANYFLNQLNSDIDMFQVEPNLVGGTRVFITLNIG